MLQLKTKEFINKSYEYVEKLDRSIDYKSSGNFRKNEYAKIIAEKEKIEDGLICVFKIVEPCISYDIFKNKETHKLELRIRQRKCS